MKGENETNFQFEMKLAVCFPGRCDEICRVRTAHITTSD